MTRVSKSVCMAWVLVSLWIPVRNVAASQIRVVTANPPEAGIHELVEAFELETGQVVDVEAMGTGAINELLASDEPADVVFGTISSIDTAERSGVTRGAGTEVGRVGIGVIVRRGASHPDVSTVDALRLAALEADAVIYNTAGSGQYVDRMFDGLGIGAEVRLKSARPGNAGETVQRLVDGVGSEIGFGLVSEMRPYDGREIDLVAPLPEAVQNYVVFEGVVLARSGNPGAAEAFLRFVTTPRAREVLGRHGMD